MSQFTRLFEVLEYQQENFPQQKSLSFKEGNEWKSYTSAECLTACNKVSAALLALGIQPGDKVAIISNNRPEWNFTDIGMLQIGAINVPIYPTITEKDFAYIFNDAEVKIVFVSNEDLWQKVNAVRSNCKSIQHVISYDTVENATNWSEFLSLGTKQDWTEDITARKNAIDPMELATIIYTSGTTGIPKGVMLSHHNIASNILSVNKILPLGPGIKTLSFLPLCHIFERVVLYTYLYNGCNVYYAESIDTLGENLKEVKPHFFSCVPRLLEKVFEKIIAKGNDLTGIKKTLFFWAVDLGMKFDYQNRSGWYNFKLGIARKLIFSKWKEALGGEVVGIVTGAAALQERLERIFNAAGIQLRQGYGMTESSPVITVNRFEEHLARMGTVGTTIENVEIKLDPNNGEILCKGSNVMMGYYNKPEETAKTIIDGWLHTGDVGAFTEDGFLKITDRIKQLFKTSGGKYVAPQPIEAKYVESPYVEQIMVVGNNRKFVGALIIPSFQNLEIFCKKNKIDADSNEDIIYNPQVKQLFEDIKDECNKNFSRVEQVKKIHLLPVEWTIDGGELTPTMKVKRKTVVEKYQAEIESIYNS